MRFLWTIVAISLAVLGAAVLSPGSQPWILLAAPCLAAALVLIALRRGKEARAPKRPPGRDGRRERGKRPSYIVVDGSNVMHWAGDPPTLEPVIRVLDDLEARGFTPGVIFDANAGYKLFDRYHGAASFAERLNLPSDRVFVVPKGTQADLYILQSARQLGARVVTNDRYRDWQEQFPEVGRRDFLIRGGERDGGVWLSLQA